MVGRLQYKGHFQPESKLHYIIQYLHIACTSIPSYYCRQSGCNSYFVQSLNLNTTYHKRWRNDENDEVDKYLASAISNRAADMNSNTDCK